MKKTQPKPSNSQTDLFKEFDRENVREERFVTLLIEQIPNIKYLRASLRLSLHLEADKRAIAHETASAILLALAQIIFEKSRWVAKYKYHTLADFIEMTREHRELSSDNSLSSTELLELAESVASRTRGVFSGHKERLKGQEPRIQSIHYNFKYLENLCR